MTTRKTTFEIDNVILSSERLPRDVELRNVTVDIDIFEHIDKPYLTGTIVVIDDNKLLEDADILGGEKIFISISSTSEEISKAAVKKTFRIGQVDVQERTGDDSQVLLLHLVEEHGYISNLLNVNRAYTGSPSSIIQKISSNFLNKNVTGTLSDQQSMKIIVPNMHPDDAMCWLAKRATTGRGYPFYLFSTLVGDDIQMHDLGTMLQQQPLNSGINDAPFQVNAVAGQSSMSPQVQRRIIKNHKFSTTANLLEIIEAGVVGASYEYIDTINESTNTFSFDIVEDLYKRLNQDDVLTLAQGNPAFSNEFKHDDKSFNEHKSKDITNVGGSGAFRESIEDGFFTTYGEDKSKAAYKLNVIAKAMNKIFQSDPLTINVDGSDFIAGDKNRSIGNNIRVRFNTSQPENKGIDSKKSGDYLIYSARHMFKRSVEKYECTFTCVKIGNYKRASS